MRAALRDWTLWTRDLGFLPEDEIHSRSAGETPYEMAKDAGMYPLEQILTTADAATSLDSGVVDALVDALSGSDSAVRYWGAMGLLMRGERGVSQAQRQLRHALADESPSVRIVAAEALGRFGDADDIAPAIDALLNEASPVENGVYRSLAALNAIDYLDEKAATAAEQIAALPTQDPKASDRMGDNVSKLLRKLLADIE
jgi:uncharacterized sulfatase